MPRIIFEFEDNELFEQLLGRMQDMSAPMVSPEEKVFQYPWLDRMPVTNSPCLSCANYGKGPCHCTLGSSVIC